jgi:hypothetical protein
MVPSGHRKGHKQLQEGYRYPGRAKWPCKPEMRFAGDFLKLNTSALAWAPGIKIGTGKIEKGFSSLMLLPAPLYTSLIYRAVQESHNWRCI